MVLGIVPVTVSTLAFFLAYRGFPNRHVPALHALAGAFLAALVFEFVKSLFAGWIRLVPTYRLVYGAFAAIPIFLLWIYLTWIVVLLGAEFTAALAYWRDRMWRRSASLAARLSGALEVARALLAAGGRAVTAAELGHAARVPVDQVEDLLHGLLADGAVRRHRRGWLLAKPASQVTLGAVFRAANPDHALAPEEWARCSAELGGVAQAMETAFQRPLQEFTPEGEGAKAH
jgi:membrane protein